MAPFLPRLLVAAAAACLSSVASGEHVQYQIRRGEIASRATNLGGWLCAEYWMAFTSPLYKDVPSSVGLDGEFAVMTLLGKDKGTKQFEQHWKTFITEEDVAKIAKTGMNTVRVSTGFWIINDEDTTDQSTLTNTYAKGGLKYLDKLVNEWGVKYNLAVMISLHAHRGSQNGMDHSAPAVKGKTMWSDDPANVASSLNYATFIANRYRNSPAFLGLNLMNEPNRPTNYDILKKYYKDAYAAIRADGNDCVIVTSPWLENQGPPTMDDFMTCPEYYNVWHEYHIYYKWGWESVSKADVFKSAATYVDGKIKPWKGNPLYIGEWSLATTDEIQLTPAELTRFWQTQVKEYEQAGAGWAFWAWRHDEETKKISGWSQRQLMNEGIVDIPTTELKRTPNPLCKVITTRGNDTLPLLSSSSSSGSSSGSQETVVVPKATASQPEQKQSAVAASPPPSLKSAATSRSLGTAFLAVASAALAWMTL